MARRRLFPGSRAYWEGRYSHGGSSGPGSYGVLAQFKASTLNSFVLDHQIATVIEFGCGDGNQLSLSTYPEYVGLDVSRTALRLCIQRFGKDTTKTFLPYDSGAFHDPRGVLAADLALSLDVLQHLVEDEVYDAYMSDLFAAAKRYVVIYGPDGEGIDMSPHVRIRCFTEWVQVHAPEWVLTQTIANTLRSPEYSEAGSPYDFYVFAHRANGMSVAQA